MRRRMRRLIVNADDFGRSSSINEAVIRAHREGILTTASLMVNEPGAAEAIELAKANPGLGVGLHLALVCGKPALTPQRIPHLVNGAGQFPDNAAVAGMRCFFSRAARAEARAEIAAQFERFASTSLSLDHVNGHLHFHLHPVVLEAILAGAERWKVRTMRLTVDPFFLNARLAGGHWIYRASHAILFGLLSARARSMLRQRGIRTTDRVFGLLQNGRVEREYVARLVERLPEGDSELYSHPCAEQFKDELAALVDPAIKARLVSRGIRLIRYQDL